MSEPSAATTASRRLPKWVWIVLGALAAALIVVLVLVLGRSTPDAPPAVTAPSASATESPSPTPSETPTPAPDEPGLDADLTENFLAALNSGNTSIFAQGGYFSDPIQVVGAASGLNQAMTPVEAVSAIDPLLSLEIAEPWEEASAADIETYRSGAYAEYFPDGAIVVKSSQDHVISFIGSGHTVTTLFLVMVTDSLLP